MKAIHKSFEEVEAPWAPAVSPAGEERGVQEETVGWGFREDTKIIVCFGDGYDRVVNSLLECARFRDGCGG